MIKRTAFHGGWTRVASTAYSEQLGSNRQAPPRWVVPIVLYIPINSRRTVFNPLSNLLPTSVQNLRKPFIVELLIKVARSFPEH